MYKCLNIALRNKGMKFPHMLGIRSVERKNIKRKNVKCMESKVYQRDLPISQLISGIAPRLVWMGFLSLV